MTTTLRSPAPASSRPFKIGLALDCEGITMPDDQTPRWADLLAMTRVAEAIGLDSVWLADHLLIRMGGRTLWPLECFSLLSALAVATERITLGTIVACTSFRSPALTAKMADTIDEISNNRLVLGLGAGWHEPEYAAFGYPFDHRASRFAEALTIIHTLLHEGAIDFDGTYYQARECELRPRDPRSPAVPIMIGTRGERMLGLTARYAEMWNAWLPSQGNDPSEMPPLLARVDAVCQEAGRDPTTLERTVAVQVCLSGATRYGAEPIRGTPEEIAASLRAFAPLGITHVQVLLTPHTAASVEAFASVLEHLDRGEGT